jgi:hypothetical protein
MHPTLISAFIIQRERQRRRSVRGPRPARTHGSAPFVPGAPRASLPPRD